MADKIIYKNHCTPQEQVSVNGRYYLDGDCGRKLTGSAVISGLTAVAPVTITASASLGGGNDYQFVSITLVSGDDITIGMTGSGSAEVISLSEGENFSSKIKVAAEVYVNITGTSEVEYFKGNT